jgi:hypothetical protein
VAFSTPFAKDPMSGDQPEEPKIFDSRVGFVRKLAQDTGVSEEQGRYLISMVGYDYPSIVREARILKKRQAMSIRGLKFLHQWLSNNIPETAKADVISVDELTHKLIADAKSVGIKRDEIDEEVDSLYQTILDAIVH